MLARVARDLPQLGPLLDFTGQPHSVLATYGLVLSSFVIGVHYMQHTRDMQHTRAPYNFGWFGVLLGDNRFNFVHHSTNPKFYNKNYAALFPVIDMMFGTYQRPDPTKLPKTGLRDRRGAKNLGEFFTGKLPRK